MLLSILIIIITISVISFFYTYFLTHVSFGVRKVSRDGYRIIRKHGAFKSSAFDIYYGPLKQINRIPFIGILFLIVNVLTIAASLHLSLYLKTAPQEYIEMVLTFIGVLSPGLLLAPYVMVKQVNISAFSLDQINAVLNDVNIYEQVLKQTRKDIEEHLKQIEDEEVQTFLNNKNNKTKTENPNEQLDNNDNKEDNK